MVTPPAAITGVSPAMAATSGTIENVPIGPGVAGGVVALRDDHVDARLDLALRLPRLADQAEDLHAALVRGLDDEGGAAEAGDEDGRALLEDHVELLPRDLLVEAAPLVQRLLPLRLGDVVLLLDDLRRSAGAPPGCPRGASRACRRSGAEAGSTRSMPKGFDPTRLRIHLMSAAISSGVCIASPRTAKPPAFTTAATTSLQCVKAMIGILDAHQVAELRVEGVFGHAGVSWRADKRSFSWRTVTRNGPWHKGFPQPWRLPGRRRPYYSRRARPCPTAPCTASRSSTSDSSSRPPTARKLFADYGADVVKVEPPDGDRARAWGPFPKDEPHAERSGLFFFLNTNKRGITLDLDAGPRAATCCSRSRKKVDVVIENFRPGRLRDWGLDYDDLARANPALVMISITPFGQTGPYAEWNGYDLNAFHLTGTSSRYCGRPGEEPLEHGTFAADFYGAVAGAAWGLAAVYGRGRAGGGQHVDVSSAEAIAATFVGGQNIGGYAQNGIFDRRTGVGMPLGAPATILPCKDGFVWMLALEPGQWNGLAKTMGNPDWMQLEMFQDMYTRAQNADAIYPLIEQWTMEHGKHEIMERCQANGVPVTAVFTSPRPRSRSTSASAATSSTSSIPSSAGPRPRRALQAAGEPRRAAPARAAPRPAQRRGLRRSSSGRAPRSSRASAPTG